MNVRAYWKGFLIEMQTLFRHRASVFFFLPAVLVPPLAVFFLWRTVLGEGTSLGTYSLSTMVTYYIVTNFFVANTPSTAWAIIGESIRDGSLATWLVRPVSHYGIFLGRVLGSWIPFWVMGLGGIACLAGILHRYFVLQTDPVRILATLIFWLGGVVLGFTWGYLLNLAAFWTERTSGLLDLADQAVIFLSGGFLPLDLLPLKELWQALPFRFIGWFPAQVYLGRVDMNAIPLEFAKLLAWFFALFGLTKLLWRRGLARFPGPGE